MYKLKDTIDLTGFSVKDQLELVKSTHAHFVEVVTLQYEAKGYNVKERELPLHSNEHYNPDEDLLESRFDERVPAKRYRMDLIKSEYVAIKVKLYWNFFKENEFYLKSRTKPMKSEFGLEIFSIFSLIIILLLWLDGTMAEGISVFLPYLCYTFIVSIFLTLIFKRSIGNFIFKTNTPQRDRYETERDVDDIHYMLIKFAEKQIQHYPRIIE